MTEWNSQILAGIVQGLGGRVVENAPTFQFDLPLDRVKEVLPKLHRLGNIGVEKRGEWVQEHPTRLKNSQTFVRLELHRRASDGE
jgi:hypothetical protein